MRTITRHWPTRLPGGDRQARCDYCGTQMRRSELTLNTQGLLYCSCSTPDDDVVQLERDNAALAEPRPRPEDPGGSLDSTSYTDPNPGWHFPNIQGMPTNYEPWK